MGHIQPVSIEPLRFWAIVVAVCALALILEAILLWIYQRQGRQRRLLRGVAALVMLVALGAVALAVRTWTVYQYYSSHGVIGRSPPPGAYLAHNYILEQANATYQTAGWITIALTMALLLVGIWAPMRAQSAPRG